MPKWCVRIVLVFGACAMPVAAADEPGGKDLKAVQGTWLVEVNTVDGIEFPKELLKKTKVIFKGEQMTQKPEIVNENGEFKLGSADGFAVTARLDESKSPKVFDVIVEAEGKKAVAKGIYELAGDDLKICFNPGAMPPKDFTSESGSGNILLVLKREKKDK